MTRTLLAAGLAAALAIPSLAAPVSASARTYCEQRAHDRRVGGTILGAVAGGLLGNDVSHGGGRTGGTLIGAGAGASRRTSARSGRLTAALKAAKCRAFFFG